MVEFEERAYPHNDQLEYLEYTQMTREEKESTIHEDLYDDVTMQEQETSFIPMDFEDELDFRFCPDPENILETYI